MGVRVYKALTFLLFSQLAVGGLWSISLIPDEAGKSFFRFCTVICGLLLGGSLLVAGPLPIATLTGLPVSLILTVILFALILLDRLSIARRLLPLPALSGTAGLVWLGYLGAPVDWPAWVAISAAIYMIATALFLGSVIFAMALGHWYLVLPTLSIDPLRKLTKLMILSTVAKTTILGLVLYLGASSTVAEIAETVEGFGRLQGLLFWARSLFGLIGPIVICYMTWETVKLNATQSATGLLYVGTIFVLVGETLSGFLYHTTHLPV